MDINKDTLYGELPSALIRSSIKEGLQPLQVSAESTVDEFINNALEDLTSQHIETIKTTLKEKPLLLDIAAKKNTKRGKGKKKRKRLTRGEINKLDLYKIPPDKQKYANFLPLNKIWEEYIKSFWLPPKFLSYEKIMKADDRLLRADYHGASISVAQSKCSSYVGIQGIVVKETKKMFTLITESDELKAIPKQECIFRFDICGFRFHVAGSKICYRPCIRACRKLKSIGAASEMLLQCHRASVFHT